MLIVPRAAAPLLAQALRTMRVVVVTGPRQAGKSTFVEDHDDLRDRPYLSLDDPATLRRARDDPSAFVRSETRLTIDEVQREPDLILAIKSVVDRQRPAIRGQFVLTGSANLLMMKRVGDSLAGRAYYLRLWPMTRREQLGLGTTGVWDRFLDEDPARWLDMVRSATDAGPRSRWEPYCARGGFPEIAVASPDLSPADRALWFDGYVTTYLERDLRDLAAVADLADVQRVMQAAALRVGNLLNQSELGRDVRLPAMTVHRYLNLLETSYQIIRLAPYAVNRTQRLIKTPKLYWADPALALHVGQSGTLAEPTGAHFENLVLCDLLAWRDVHLPRPEVTYWRTASGYEVDFVIEHQRALVGIEVKAGGRPTAADARGLRAFLAEYPRRARGGIVVHGGDESYWLDDRIVAVPWPYRGGPSCDATGERPRPEYRRFATSDLGWRSRRTPLPQRPEPAHRISTQMRYLVGVLGLGLVTAVGAAQVPTRPIGPITARATVPLGQIATLRPLSDGRVVVNDIGHQRLIVLDSTLRTATPVLDTGMAAQRLYPSARGGITGLLAGRADSTLFWDPVSVSLLVIAPNGAIVRSIATPRGAAPSSWQPVDAHGGVLLTVRGIVNHSTTVPTPDTPRPPPDSLPLVRADLTTLRVDTIASIGTARGNIQGTTFAPPTGSAPSSISRSTTFRLLSAGDDWTVMPDGTIAIVRGRDYHIDWIAADGSRTASPKIAHVWTRLSDDVKRGLIDSLQHIADSLNAAQPAASTPGVVHLHFGVASADELPDYVAPFRPGLTRADAEGNVWICITPDAPGVQSLTFDVVNRAGTLIDRVQLPGGVTLEGFGPGVAYLSSRDGAGYSLVRARIR